jgi:hypothetical protein
VRGSSAIDLGVARVTHASRENRRGRGRVSSDGRTTRRVNKRKGRRVEEGCGMRGASTTKDTTALSAVVTSLHEGEGLPTDKSIAVGGVGILLPEVAGEKDG